jgi:hypothetical protein
MCKKIEFVEKEQLRKTEPAKDQEELVLKEESKISEQKEAARLESQ